MADLSIKNLGIGLASSLLSGAISVTAATGVGASSATQAGSGGSYVYTKSNQTSADGGNAVLAFWVASGGTLASIGSFPTGGDGTGAGLGSQGAVTIADGGHALLVVNAASDSVSYFRILSNGTLSLVDAAPSGGSDPASVAVHGRGVVVLNQGSSRHRGIPQNRSELWTLSRARSERVPVERTGGLRVWLALSIWTTPKSGFGSF